MGREGEQLRIVIERDASLCKEALKSKIAKTVDELLEEADKIAIYRRNREITAKARSMAKNPSGKKGLAREYFEGAMCTGVAYAAGTLASWTISGFPPKEVEEKKKKLGLTELEAVKYDIDREIRRIKSSLPTGQEDHRRRAKEGPRKQGP